MFKKSKYFILNPRSISYTGFYKSLDEGIRISNYYNLKKIIAYPLINIHPAHKQNLIFGKKIIFKYFKTLSLDEKVLSIIYTSLLNLNLFLKKTRFLGLLSLIFNYKLIDKIFPIHFGYFGEDESYFKTDKETWKDIQAGLKSFDIPLKENKFFNNCSQYFQKKMICMHIKDTNYNVISEISNQSVSEIINHKKAIEYFLDNNFSVIRVGDNLSKNFKFENINFLDLTKNKFLNEFNQASVYQKCDFFFGNATPGIIISNFFNKCNFITNNPQEYYIYNAFSKSMSNLSIFKKIFSIEKKRILSISELFENEDILFMRKFDKNKFFLVENTSDEIYEASKTFFEKIYLNKNEKNHYLNEYLRLRKNCIDKLLKSNSVHSLLLKQNYYAETYIPSKFLEDNLYFGSALNAQSEEIIKKIKQ